MPQIDSAESTFAPTSARQYQHYYDKPLGYGQGLLSKSYRNQPSDVTCSTRQMLLIMRVIALIRKDSGREAANRQSD